jgi:hypothetical protein
MAASLQTSQQQLQAPALLWALLLVVVVVH